MTDKPEIVLVGGSKDGSVTDQTPDTTAINNIVLNDAKDGPEYVDLYLPAKVTDKEGRPIYVHVGRYDATESKSYWDSLSQKEKDALVEAANKAEEFVEEEKGEEVVEETPAAETSESVASADENPTAEVTAVPVLPANAVEEVVEIAPDATETPAEEKEPVVDPEAEKASEEKPE